jgi:hypothetical protein
MRIVRSVGSEQFFPNFAILRTNYLTCVRDKIESLEGEKRKSP